MTQETRPAWQLAPLVGPAPPETDRPSPGALTPGIPALDPLHPFQPWDRPPRDGRSIFPMGPDNVPWYLRGERQGSVFDLHDSRYRGITEDGYQPIRRELSDGSVDIVEDDNARRLSEQYATMFAAGAPREEIEQFLAQHNITIPNLDWFFRYREGRVPPPRGYSTFADWRRRNPRSRYPIDPRSYAREVPQTRVRRVLGRLANSPFGAYAINAGQALTFDTIDDVVGGERTRDAIEELNLRYPASSLTGRVVGTTLNNMLLEGAGTAAGLGSRTASRVADGVYGALDGAGEAEPGDRLGGAFRGFTTNLASGEAARRTTDLLGRSLTGTRDPSTRLLDESDVPFTIGDAARRGGPAANLVSGLERRMETVPGLGERIGARRAEAAAGFDRAATDFATPGPQVIAARRRAGDGVRMTPDDAFNRDWDMALSLGRQLPRGRAAAFRRTIAAVAPDVRGGRMTGAGYQRALRRLRNARVAALGRPGGQYSADLIASVERSIENLARRQAPDMAAALESIEAMAARNAVIREAAARGEGGLVTPAGLTDAVAAGSARSDDAARRLAPVSNLARAGKDVLGERVAALASAPIGSATPLQRALFDALSLPYSETGAAMLRKLIATRPERVRRAGERLLQSKAVPSAVAATLDDPVESLLFGEERRKRR
jgi:hypothetical protein